MKALILQDEPLYTETLSNILRKSLGFGHICCLTMPEQAVLDLRRRRYDLILADIVTIDLAGFSGLEALVDIANGGMIVAFDSPGRTVNIHRTRVSGANAYIPKNFSRELIESALRFVLAGGRYFPDHFAASRKAMDEPNLSPRQAQVLSMLRRGASNAEIAQGLNITVGTVKLHVHAILKVTGARSRTELLQVNERGSFPQSDRAASSVPTRPNGPFAPSQMWDVLYSSWQEPVLAERTGHSHSPNFASAALAFDQTPQSTRLRQVDLDGIGELMVRSMVEKVDVRNGIFRIVEEFLSISGISDEDDFFGMGGTSLNAVNIMFALSEEFGIDLPIELLFDYPTMGELSQEVEKQLSA